jgi:hypothetical protein
VPLEGIGHAPLQPGVGGVAELAERGHDGLLAFLDDEDAAAQPDQRDDASDQAGADAGALHVGLEVRAAGAAAVVTAARAVAAPAALLAAEQAAELAVEVAPEFVEVGRAVVATVVEHELPAGHREVAQALQEAG